MAGALNDEGARVLVLNIGRIGNVINVRGVIEALGGDVEWRPVKPRWFYARMAPLGPLDPKDRAGLLADPPPDIVIASGRIAVPYIRELKKAYGGRVFAVFLQDPRFFRGLMDLIWTPAHDSYRGPNSFVTLVTPHPFTAEKLESSRKNPDPRLACLPKPRCAVLLGGPTVKQFYMPSDIRRLSDAIRTIAAEGFSVMATPSRRTPPSMLQAVREGLGKAPGFVWDREGGNPYLHMLALADAVLVTSDSANMVGEATATGKAVHIIEPSGGHARKLTAQVDELIRRRIAVRFDGRVERFSYEPIHSGELIAAEIARRFRASRGR
jgi:mitochondrial fission protein ELM1